VSARFALLSVLFGLPGLLAPEAARAGAFIFAEDFPDAITHPQVYSGSGGERPDLTVCLDRSVNSILTQRAEPAVIKAVATWNRGRSLAADNLAVGNATDINRGFDFESVLLHELGHCQGLNHVNHASESGLSDPQANGSKSTPGPDGVFNQGAGSDGLHGSRDDLRGDDVNLHWYVRGQNNPGVFLAIADTTTLARELIALPAGHRFAANADLQVMAALGFANSEAVMQQGTSDREAQRHLHHDDLMTLRLARSGLNRIQGNSDDYRYQLRYVGRLSNPSNADCNVRIRIDNSTGFAVCGVGANTIGGSTNQWRIVQAEIAMNSSIDWYFTDGPNTVTSITASTPSPSQVGQAYSVAVRVQEASGINISGNPFGTVEVDDGQGASCSFELSSAMNGQGSCSLTGGSAGDRTLTARFFGRGGYDYSEASASHSVTQIRPTTTRIVSRVPSSSVVGQPYTVNFSVSATGATPTGSVSVSDGSASCQATLSGGSGSCALTSLNAGSRTLTASYTPTGDFAPSSDTASHPVGRANTALTVLADTPDPSAHAQLVNVGWRVDALAPSTAAPAGSVSVSGGNGELCSALASVGQCSLRLLGTGPRSLQLSFAGNSNFNGSQASEPHSVLPAQTVTAITSDAPDPSVVGQGYQVQVTVSASDAAPLGEVTISDGMASCNAALVNGNASCGLASTSAGTRTLTASYAGSADFAPSSATASHQVNPAATSTRVLDTYPQPSAPGQPVNVLFEVLPVAPGSGQPGGSVSVTGEPGETCTASVAMGRCDLVLNSAGARSLQVSYAGSADFNPSGTTITQQVSADALFVSGFEAVEQ
jgi:hypothetical protein